ncbi:MAG: gliding motility-associated C-terminal domain-containing protein [Spirochaetes bacterium]|nr:gliding motility-associated C-terminal domain-containing protein [Spirochaetota bacterium]
MKKIFIIFMVVLLSSSLLLSQVPESFILEKGGVKSIGYGNANSSRSGETEFFTESPASPADLEVPVLSLNYGDMLGYNNFVNLSYSHPTLRGVISGNIKYFNANNQNIALDSAININLNFSKIFTDKLFIGLGAGFLTADYFNDNGVAFGVDLGGIYHVYAYNKNRSNKTLQNVTIGFSLLNIGTALSYQDTVISPPIKIKTGPSFIFNFGKHFQNITSIDLELRKFSHININFGLENIIYNKFILRFGLPLEAEESEYQDFSAGLGYKFKIKNIGTELDYSFTALKDDNYLHYLGMEMRFGQTDEEAPETKINFNLSHISPNYDGKADYLEITPDINDNRALKGWKVQIVDNKDNPVKEYKSPDMDVLKGKLTIQKIFKRLFEKRKEAPVPDKIVWDGINKEGQDVPDGEYKVILTAYDEKLNESDPIEKKFFLDKTPPEVSIKPQFKIFSPNGDGVKDSVNFQFTLKTEPEDQWSAKIVDNKGKTVLEHKWKGDKIPSISWDGKDKEGKMAPDGNYDLIVQGSDLAQNSVKKGVYGITLTTAKQSVAVSSSLDGFSPNNDKVMDTTEFDMHISDQKGLEKWKLTVLNESGKEVRSFEGSKEAPPSVTWDGRDDNENVLPDDDYLYKFEVWYDSGNHPESFPKKIKIDSTPPDVKLEILPDIFSPDGDQTDDMALINLNIKDKSDVKKWKVHIFESENNKKKLFKKFEQTGKPGETIIWNGLSEEGNLVQSKNRYFLLFEIEDDLGNKTLIENREIKISQVPPDVDFEYEPSVFSPDDDGENDLLTIKLFSHDNRKKRSWKLNIYPIRGGKRESLFISFSGQGLKSKPIIWDGRSPKGELVESAMDYELELMVEDVLGNTQTVSKTLNVDILVIKTDYGLKIRISNIEFEYNKAELRGNAFDILDRVIPKLEKYPTYKVRIEGHTDNIGSEEYNLKLSEKRAKSVFDYCVENGISSDRLSMKGMGFVRPVAPNSNPDGSDNPEGRAKNRRVEFLLIKPGATVK